MRHMLFVLILALLLSVIAHADQIDDLCAAAKAGDVATVTRLVQANRALVFSKDALGETALIDAAEAGQTDAVKALLVYGADPERADDKEWTPLEKAAQGGHAQTVAALIAGGASVAGAGPLNMAAQSGNVDTIRVLLAHHADPNAQGYARGTPLFFVGDGSGVRDAVTALVQGGADTEARDWEGCTLLMHAVVMDDTELVKALLDNGADPNATVSPSVTRVVIRSRHQGIRMVSSIEQPSLEPPLREARSIGNDDLVAALIAGGAHDKHAYLWGPDTPLPTVEDGVAMVPLHRLADWAGATFTFKEAAVVEATATLRERKADFTEGSTTALVDSLPVALARAPEVIDGSLYVPLRALAAAWRAPLSWDEARLEMTLGHPSTEETLTFALGDPATDGGPPSSAAKGAFPVLVNDVLIGGALDGAPVRAEQMVGSLQEGARYKLYSPDRYLGTTTAHFVRMPTAKDASADVEWTPELTTDGDIIAIAGEWNALPRASEMPHSLPQEARWALAGVLKEHGLSGTNVNVWRCLSADLNGDGTQELVVAGTTANQWYLPIKEGQWIATVINGVQQPTPPVDQQKLQPDDYSLVVVRRVVDGTPHTLLLAGDFHATVTEPNPYAVEYNLIGLLDVNGDGTLEPIITMETSEQTHGIAAVTINGDTATMTMAGYWEE